MKKVQSAKRSDVHNLPTVHGLYYWSEWKCLVTVFWKGRSLWVKPPGGVEIRVTPFIAGTFEKRF